MAVDAAPALSPRQPALASGPDAVLRVFSVLWAVAAIFHLLGGSARATGVIDDWTLAGASDVAVGAAAVWVLARRGSSAALAVLAATSAVSAWIEAPFLGTHWFAAALIDLGLLGAMAASLRGWRVDRERLQSIALPLARWSLIGFYSWAAFAKLNRGFFNTKTGCGTFYFDELAASLGARTPIAVGSRPWAVLVPISVAAIELSIPVLLLVRRTRVVGVVLGVIFHSTIALDQTHLFQDFSSLLLALFALFLAPRWAEELEGRWRSQRDGVRRGAGVLVVSAPGLVLLAQWTASRSSAAVRVYEDARLWLWLAFDLAIVLSVVGYGWRHRAGADRPLALDGVPRWLWTLPAIVILNGLAPYLGVRTAYAYNMYANLVTADGTSNHLLIARTANLAGDRGELVRITETDDPRLIPYITQRFDLPYLSLRAYLAAHPSAAVTYVRDGVEHRLRRASDEPDLVRPVSAIERRLFALRAVDQQDPPRCQDTFLPAL